MKHMLRRVAAVLLSCLLLAAAGCGKDTDDPVVPPPEEEKTALSVGDLTCEYLSEPINIDVTAPRFGWQLSSDIRGQEQTAYQILVSSTETNAENANGDMWDSGKVTSDKNYNVVYGGKGLRSDRTYYWRVRVWDKDDTATEYSETATFGTALLAQEDWRAEWIGAKDPVTWKTKRDAIMQNEYSGETHTRNWYNYGLEDNYNYAMEAGYDIPPIFRTEKTITKPVAEAKLYISGLGYYETYINGTKVGDRVLEPGVTNYNKTVYYTTYDVTDMLTVGENAFGVLLGGGWYCMTGEHDWGFDRASWTDQSKFIYQMHIRYEDGTTDTVVSNTDWKVTDSALRFSGIRIGEVYDATCEHDGWNEAGYDDSAWTAAYGVAVPAGELKSYMIEPIRIVREIEPTLVNKQGNSYLFDLGEVVSGAARIRLNGTGRAGEKVTVHFNEEAKRGGIWGYIYIMKGEPEEVFHPYFFYNSARYLEVVFDGEMTADDVTGTVIHTDLEKTGFFESSNELVNTIDEMLNRTVTNLIHSYPQDCPSREKLGWMDHHEIMSQTLMYNYDTQLFYEKWNRDMRDAQSQHGGIGYVMPTDTWGNWDWGTELAWSGSFVFVPWYLYEQTGDDTIFRNSWEQMKKWIDWYDIQRDQPDNPYGVAGERYIMKGGNGDWVPPINDKVFEYGPNAPEGPSFLNTAYYLKAARIMHTMAEHLGDTAAAYKYELLAENIAAAMQRVFFDEEKGYYISDQLFFSDKDPEYYGYRETPQIFALQMGIVEKDDLDTVWRDLIDDLVIGNKVNLDTGMFGAKVLLDLLPENGYEELAYAILTNTDYPGWGYVASLGHTAFPESWDARSVNDTGTLNHACYASPGKYLYHTLGGIRVDGGDSAYAEIRLQPSVVGDLTYVNSSIMTTRGRVTSDWRKENGTFVYEVTVPVGSTAVVSLPKIGYNAVKVAESGTAVFADGACVPGADGISDAREEGDRIEVRVASGRYEFVLSEADGIDMDVQTFGMYEAFADGVTKRVSVSVTNRSQTALAGCSAVLSAPAGWTITAAEAPGTVEAGGTAVYSFDVTAQGAEINNAYDVSFALTANGKPVFAKDFVFRLYNEMYEDDLSLCYDFTEIAEGAVPEAYDGIDIVLFGGPSVVPGHTASRSAIDFRYAHEYGKIAPHPALTPREAITLSVWVKTEVASGSDKGTIFRMDTASGTILLRTNGTDVEFGLGTADNAYSELKADYTAYSGEWTMITAVYDGAHKSIYLNGRLAAREAATGKMLLGGIIGSRFTENGETIDNRCAFIGTETMGISREKFYGQISELRLWSTGLTAERVAAVYETSK